MSGAHLQDCIICIIFLPNFDISMENSMKRRKNLYSFLNVTICYLLYTLLKSLSKIKNNMNINICTGSLPQVADIQL